MTTVISTDLTGSNTLIYSTTENTDFLIEDGVQLSTSASTAVWLKGGLHDLTVKGTVQAHNYGVVLGDAFATHHDNHLVVTAGGAITGSVLAVAAWGSSTVLNEGTLTGGGIGLRLNMSGTTASEVTNYGTISGGEWGIDSSASGVATLSITNHGAVRGGVYSFIDRGGAADRLVNTGLLDGDVNFGAGSDHLDNRSGQIQGEVLCGTGDDAVLLGAGVEILQGGDGLDTLDFRDGGGLRVSLLAGTGTGWAQGDVFLGFERVLGSQRGADTLIGDGWNNVLEGLGGNDTLSGGRGADSLAGGRGADRLRGGGENDVFLFASAKDGGDTIADFGSVVGNDDRFHLDASGFGAGLAVGALAASRFRARADNDAQDGNDRFVFRTTDKTLWFDADGSGAKAAVLLADLQASANLTASDILMI